MDEARVKLLRQCPLLVGFHEGQLESLFNMIQVEEYKHGDVIIEEGSPGESVYILINGSVDVEKMTEEGTPALLTSLASPGDYFGEMAIVDVRPRSATVRARGKTELVSISKETFFTLFDEYPELMILVPSNIAKILADRLREVDETMATLAG